MRGGGVGDEYGEDGEEEGGGDDDDIDFPYTNDANSVPYAEVKKYSFLERLRHYMDGNKISDANRKCVECVDHLTLTKDRPSLSQAHMKRQHHQ
jgi:hypothetical protein